MFKWLRKNKIANKTNLEKKDRNVDLAGRCGKLMKMNTNGKQTIAINRPMYSKYFK